MVYYLISIVYSATLLLTLLVDGNYRCCCNLKKNKNKIQEHFILSWWLSHLGRFPIQRGHFRLDVTTASRSLFQPFWESVVVAVVRKLCLICS